MDKLRIVSVDSDDKIDIVVTLAKEIWNQHFTPIIGPAQVTYMLDKFQSYSAIKKQIQEGYKYFLMDYDNTPVGYSGVHEEDGRLFLSKIYIKENCRGKGISSAVIDFYVSLCRNRNLSKIWLTCNKNNYNSIAAYEHMGFVTVRTQVADIGHGYVMDDVIMEKPITTI